MSDYVPRAGSFAQKAIEYLRMHREATTAVLADHGDVELSSVAGQLQWPVKQGAVRMEKRAGLCYWSLGDGKALPKPAEDDDEPDTPREGLQHVVKAAEHLPTRPPRAFGCGIFSDGRLVLELASGEEIVLQRDETTALVKFLDRMLCEELAA